ncbi:monovalent cation:proton antiporter family protein [Caldibacillus lycopersici]|uniref:Monovalent cation:proton antiporter family protein n=1 Tax=Perspicuibacillus lycopersici TaxID=1325689 RepID=A0AAE3IPZ2_9BACI|nr:monovalent cation:proton antiporter family protein [Perspicuibacillus lycopersici]MCU9612425.1 monovalent cation:proton antiporter family protein [Perspicuibacillus lycopersici]
MEHGDSITSLVIVIIAAFLTPIVLHRLRLNIIPVVVAEILIGLIIGKSGLNMVHGGTWLETLSTLGFIFLMFLSGLEIDFSAFSKRKKDNEQKNGPNALFISIIIFVGIFIISFGLSYLFVIAGFIDNAILMTIIISTISLGVVVPTLKEEHLMKSTIGQIILLVAVIADLATMIMLAIFVSLYEGGGNTWLLLVLFGVGIIIYFAGKRLKNGKIMESLAKGTVQIGTRAVFTLIIFLVALSETVGAENILGAFLAGVLVSLLAPSQELVHQLDSFGYGFLIPIFFVMIGVDLDIWSLFSDPKLLLLIPLLLIGLLISKIIPIIVLKKWFDSKTVVASGVLLTSTLSLVIAAATIGERMELITPEMSGTLILVAIISCIIAPILFKKFMPKHETVDKQLTVALIGANQLTMSVYKDLKSKLYIPTLFHRKQEKEEIRTSESIFDIVQLDSYDEQVLEANRVFTRDIVVTCTGDEEINANIAVLAKEKGVERVIARIENPEIDNILQEQGIEIFSVLLSQNVLLRAAIESPSMIDLLTNRETALYEIRMRNPKYKDLAIRRFPFTGDIIFVRIFRGLDSIVPHGETQLKMNDRLIVTGSKEYVDELKRELEFND